MTEHELQEPSAARGGADPAASIDPAAAAQRIRERLPRTPLAPFPCPDLPIELRLKLECLQETGSFKARGAWNQISLLSAAEREAGVVATSSGNHGRALAWAARAAGVRATLFMPQDVYPNKLAACRAEQAEIVLCRDRPEAEERCAESVARGATLVHPFHAARTIEGAGSVGLEIAEEWPEVELVLVPIGGGGLISGCALALKRSLGERVTILGVEPVGSPNMSRALEAGEPVVIDPITTKVQGLCPMATGALNLSIVQRHVAGVLTLEDERIFAAQRTLVRAGHRVEAAGAATFAALGAGAPPPAMLEGRGPANPLRVACVVSGGNCEPEELARLS